MFDTIIVSGGNIQSGFALDFFRKTAEQPGQKGILTIAADRGLEFFGETGITPDVVIGDFDSLSLKGKEYLERLGKTEIIRLKPEKDDSDTQSAAKLAIKRGSEKILILGATGTRLDHVMANLELLCMAEKQGVSITMADAHNYIRLVKSGTILRKKEQFGKYVSLFPMDGDVTGLTLTGFKYPLSRYQLKTSDGGLTVSNEIAEETAEITFDSGMLLMIMSRD